MTTTLWLLAALVSAVVMAAASRFAVGHAVAVAEKLRLPPFFVGITLVALGTDMPEIVNSITASYMGHGDIAVGDAIGSVFTQGALVLGLVPFIARATPDVNRREVLLLCVLTITALGLAALVFRDGAISRLDAGLLVLVWPVATIVAWRYGGSNAPDVAAKPDTGSSGISRHVVLALLAFAVVGGAAAVVVSAITFISVTIGVPEYILSFFGAALATSLPELAVEFAALRKGHHAIAVGNVFGSNLIDSSLAVGIGPLLFPTVVTASLAIQGTIIAAITVTLAALLIGVRRKLDRPAGALLLAAYLGAYVWFA